MLTLCGFAASNYYNKVKIALLEKGVDFTEQLAWVGEVDRQASPLGKVPYLITDQGGLCESSVMLEYIEQRYPQNPLLPSDPFAAANVLSRVNVAATISKRTHPHRWSGHASERVHVHVGNEVGVVGIEARVGYKSDFRAIATEPRRVRPVGSGDILFKVNVVRDTH